MSQYNPGPFKTFTAAATAIPAYRFVKTPGALAVATAGTDKILGVTGENGGGASENTTVNIGVGITAKLQVSAAVSVGAYLTATTGGKGVTTTTAGQVVRAIALEEATADNDVIEVLLTYFHHKA